MGYKDPVRIAAVAHTDLNIFAAVVSLLESSLQSNQKTVHSSSTKIIRIAKQEQQRCLIRYDEAVAAAKGRP